MDAYKTPQADVDVVVGRAYQPVKALVLGLLVSVVLALVVSIIETIAVAIAFGLDLTKESELMALVSRNITFMLFDLLVTALIMFFAGSVVGRYTPGKEVKFGLILSVLTLAVFVPMSLISNSYAQYPLWYHAVSVASIFIAIYLGARPRRKA
jgi:hypothetical protein